MQKSIKKQIASNKIKEIKVGQIWSGYTEFPGDFYKRNGMQKDRPLIILKIHPNGIVRVGYSSSKLKGRKHSFNIKTSTTEYNFNVLDSYNIPIKNLKNFWTDLTLEPTTDKHFKYLKQKCDYYFAKNPERVEYERKIYSGELNNYSKRKCKLERTHGQFSSERCKQLFNPKYVIERKQILNKKKK